MKVKAKVKVKVKSEVIEFARAHMTSVYTLSNCIVSQQFWILFFSIQDILVRAWARKRSLLVHNLCPCTILAPTCHCTTHLFAPQRPRQPQARYETSSSRPSSHNLNFIQAMARGVSAPPGFFPQSKAQPSKPYVPGSAPDPYGLLGMISNSSFRLLLVMAQLLEIRSPASSETSKP